MSSTRGSTPPTSGSVAAPAEPVEFGLLSQVAEQAANPAVFLDGQYRVMYINPAFTEVFGHPLPACQGQLLSAALHPRDACSVMSALEALRPGHSATLPRFRVPDAAGVWRWLTGRVTHLPATSGSPAFWAQLSPEPRLRDAYRDALRTITRTLASTSEVPDSLAAVLNTGLQVMQADAGGLYRLSADGEHLELLGQAGYAAGATDGWQRFPVTLDTPISQAARTRTPVFLSDAAFRRAYPALQAAHANAFSSAAVLPLLIGERLLGTLSLSFNHDRDFSEDEQDFLQMVADLCAPALDRALLQQAKLRQQSWEQVVNQNSSDIVTIIDEQGRILYESGSVQGILGYLPSELIGQSVCDLIHLDERQASYQAIAAVAATGVADTAIRRFRHRDGHWVWLECVGRDLRDHEAIGGILVNSRDVSARVAAEQAREASVRALEESERNFRRLADNSSDFVRQYAADGRLEYCSPNVRDLLGYSSEEMLGPDPLHLVYEEDLPATRAAFEHRLTAMLDPVKLEYRLKHKDGTPVWVETTFKTIRDPLTGVCLAFNAATRDIRQRKQAELEVKAQLGRYRQLLEFTVSLEQRSTRLELVEEVLQKCLVLTEYDYGYAFSFDAGRIALLSAAGAVPTAKARGEDLGQLPFAAPIWRALRRREPYFISQDTPLFEPPEPTPRSPWRCLCLLPVAQEGDLGVILVFGTDQDVTISEETRQLLPNVVARLSRALERSHHIEQLNTSREETLRALGLALEYRDYETKGHTDRVVHFTERLGRALGFRGDDLDALRWGAFLHDTGKVAIPDSILLKPAQLTPEEWDVIKRHPTIGYEMLQHIPSLPPITLEVVLYHQERWNGSGYPKGLSGSDIPLAARVFAVVDVYDALTSERPYKKAWTTAQAARQLREDGGRLLDERVVHCFLELLSAGEEAGADPQEVCHD